MPRITTYDAPDNLGLRPTDTGVTATVQAARRVEGNYREAAAAEIDQGRRIASTIDIAGDIALKAIDHQQISHGAEAFAGFTAGKTKEWNETVKTADPNDPTTGERFIAEKVEPEIEKFKAGFITERGRAWAEARSSEFREHMFRRTSADMATMAGEAAKLNFRRTTNALSSTVRDDPSSLDFSLRTLETSVNDMVDSSPNLTGTTAAKVKGELLQLGKEAVVKSAVIGHIEKTGEVPEWAKDEKFAPYISGAEMKQFAQQARYYERLGQSEGRAARQQRDYEAKVDFNTRVNELRTKTMPQDVGARPTLPVDYWQQVRELSKHPGAALEPSLLKTLITEGDAITNRLNKPEPLSQVSHRTTVDMLRRIRASDDTRLTSLDEIYKAYDDGKLNTADFNFLNKEYRDMQTPDGQRLGRTKDDFFKAVKPAIDKSNPLMGKIDQDGPLNMYRFETDVNRKIDDYRKAGKDPADLFDPAKPDYLGKPAALAPYQKPLTETLRDQARRASGRTTPGTTSPPAPPVSAQSPRKPGETPDEYLKRLGIR